MHKLKNITVFGLLALAGCAVVAEDTSQLYVDSAAQAIARDAEAMAALNEKPNSATAANIVDALTEAALDPSILETTDPQEILATGCATIMLRVDADTVVSAHVKLDKTADGPTGVVSAAGVCQA